MMRSPHRTPDGQPCGESHHRTTHPDADVIAARDLHDAGYGWRRIARMLNLPPSWVKDVVEFSRRPYVRPQYDNGPAERLR